MWRGVSGGQDYLYVHTAWLLYPAWKMQFLANGRAAMPCVVHGCLPTPCSGGDALPGRRSSTRSCVSPASYHRAIAGLIKASWDRPHLLLISVHGNESGPEIVDVRFDE